MSFTDSWFCEVSSPNGLFYSLEEREEKSCGLWACYLLFSNTYCSGYALSTTRLLKTKRSVILNCFWFEDLLLLVIDVIKPPGIYLDNWLQLSCRLDLPSSAWILSPLPSFFCMLRCSAGFSSRVSKVQSVFNFSWPNIACKLRSPARFLQQTT